MYDLRRHESALGGELERRRAFRRGTMFMSNEGIVHASELTDEEYRQYVKGSGLPDFDDVDDTFTRQ
jgi:hypothetical protein